MTIYLGDLIDGGTHDFMFTTVGSTGLPTVLTGSPALSVYKDNNTTETTTGPTLTASFDTRVGMNHVRLVLTDAFYVPDTDYSVVITAGTVGGVSVVGYVVAQFSISNRMPNVNVTEWLDTTVATPTVGGVPEVDVTHQVGGLVPTPNTTGIPDVNAVEILDTAPSLTTGDLDVNVASMAAGTVTAAAIATGAIDADSIAADAITAAKVADGTIDAATFAAGAIDAAAIAAGAIDTDAFTAAAIRQVGGMLVSGTASGAGSTTTLVDTSLTETDDIWTGNWILFTGGTPVIANQCRLITNFDAASDTVTFAPAVAAATDATTTFEIYAYGGADVQSWLGLNTAMAAPNALVGGAVDSDVSAMQAGTITATAIATDAIDDDAIATGAIASTAFAAGAIDAAAIGTGAIDADAIAADAIGASEIANGAIDAATFAAGAINAAALATDAVDEIADGVWDENIEAAHGTDATAGLLLRVLGAVISNRANNATLDALLGVADTASNDVPNQILDGDTLAELAQAQPATTPTMSEAMMLLYMALRNELDSTNTLKSIKNDAGTVITKGTLSDDGTTFQKQKLVAGP